MCILYPKMTLKCVPVENMRIGSTHLVWRSLDPVVVDLDCYKKVAKREKGDQQSKNPDRNLRTPSRGVPLPDASSLGNIHRASFMLFPKGPELALLGSLTCCRQTDTNSKVEQWILCADVVNLKTKTCHMCWSSLYRYQKVYCTSS